MEEKTSTEDVKTETQTEQSVKNQETDSSKTAMIPKTRMDEVISERNKLRQELEQIRTNQEEAKKKQLEEQGKYKELADKLQAEKENLLKANIEAQKRMAVLAKLSLPDVKAKDSDVVMKLIDFESLKINEDGTVEGIEEQLTKLKAEKTFLFGEDKGTDTDNSNTHSTPPGKEDWGLLARTLPPAEFRKKYFEAFGIYPPQV